MSEKLPPPYEPKDFVGVVLQADAHDLPAGASADQVNVKSAEPGRLEVRRGVRTVTGDV